ncbi:SH3 domain-containing protein [Acuticoccus sp. M5D2P5]|uniref:SH3 domain-containing protein n=1 Tax=Acuticoccus kalidii TaxID=2910977 RepID=UPI001F33F6F4|nr:SH3 domain-containing protein [Acuticoccus kalidii]MCF3936508.1 SH3 domain-containing protein [Acuticoccus kalidii]
MNRAAFVIAIAILLPTAPLPATARVFVVDTIVDVFEVADGETVAIRDAPAADGAILGTLPHDARHVPVDRCDISPEIDAADWCRVRYNGVLGWVNADQIAPSIYVEDDTAAREATPGEATPD